MTRKILLAGAPLLLSASILMAQGGVAPSELLKPLKESWPTYNGDYTGRRYSALNQVNQSTVKNLTLGWATRLAAGNLGGGGGGGRGGFGGGRGGFGGGAPMIVGGVGTGDLNNGAGTVKGSILQVDGTLYV